MNKEQLTLGSLFDGSGGFPLAGILSGIYPVWASEIEPFAIRVTTKRLPQMLHYGDVSKLSGYDLPPVDIITFGSPCQDMSVAGKRAGLDGERSGLFHEAVRVIKEMRESTNGEKPRYCVWENVPGAFSSNGGADFKAVLEEIISVKEPGAEVPPPGKNGWPYADIYLGAGWSVAYRVLDAQYWGVPQRRARIFLVADFGGECAGEVLFKSEGLSGYSAESFEAWQRTARDTSGSLGETVIPALCLNTQGRSGLSLTEELTETLIAQDHGNHPAVMAAGFCPEPSAQSRSIGYEDETSPTLRAGAVPAAIALEHHPTDSRIGMEDGGIIQTLTSRMGTGGNNVPLIMKSGECPSVYHGSKNSHLTHFREDPALDTLVASEYKEPPVVSSEPSYIVRRITPVECARLQGFPDWWCSGLETTEPTEEDIAFWTEVFETHRLLVTGSSKPKTRSQIVKWLRNPYLDSAAYKMWGNGVALPCVWFVLAGIVYAHQKSCNSSDHDHDNVT